MRLRRGEYGSLGRRRSNSGCVWSALLVVAALVVGGYLLVQTRLGYGIQLGRNVRTPTPAPTATPTRSVDDFIRAANWIYGHTLLQRAWGIGFLSAWARDFLPNRAERNAFYARVGECVPPGREITAHLSPHMIEGGPKDILHCLEKV